MTYPPERGTVNSNTRQSRQRRPGSLAALLCCLSLLAPACVMDEDVEEPPAPSPAGKADGTIVEPAADLVFSVSVGYRLVSLASAPAPELDITPETAIYLWLWSGAWEWVGVVDETVHVDTSSATYLALAAQNATAEVALQFDLGPGPETVHMPIESLDQAFALGLYGSDYAAQKALNRFLGWVPDQLEHSRLLVTLEAPWEDEPGGAVVTEDGMTLRSVTRMPRSGGPTCTEALSFATTFYGAATPAIPATRGVGYCGHIGVVQSMIRLGVEGKWTVGGKLNGDKLKDIDENERQSGESGLSNDDIAKAHKRLMKAAGAKDPYCEISGEFDLTNPATSLHYFAEDLDDHVDDGWDCGISIVGTMLTGELDANGNPTTEPFEHFENVKTVVRSSTTGHAVIQTANGFSQGGGDLGGIDSAADTNSFNLRQGDPDTSTPPQVNFRDSTSGHIRGAMKGAKITRISYVCCRP